VVGGATINVFLNNGGGNFGAGAPYKLTSQFGKLDLAVGGDYGTAPPLGILLGNGDGTFQAPSYPNGYSGQSLTAEDFNGDGKPDLAVVNGAVVDLNDSNTITILLNSGR
jgi:hypothetical protein